MLFWLKSKNVLTMFSEDLLYLPYCVVDWLHKSFQIYNIFCILLTVLQVLWKSLSVIFNRINKYVNSLSSR